VYTAIHDIAESRFVASKLDAMLIHVQYAPVHPERKLVPQLSPLYLRMYHSAYRSRRWSVTTCQTLEMKEYPHVYQVEESKMVCTKFCYDRCQ
jgi:hypothetical protein